MLKIDLWIIISIEIFFLAFFLILSGIILFISHIDVYGKLLIMGGFILYLIPFIIGTAKFSKILYKNVFKETIEQIEKNKLKYTKFLKKIKKTGIILVIISFGLLILFRLILSYLSFDIFPIILFIVLNITLGTSFNKLGNSFKEILILDSSENT
ncbi:MAG: hypothetical protein ACTSR8_11940 [Promethearchaeota archaeon]